jgi:hypothetical protein
VERKESISLSSAESLAFPTGIRTPVTALKARLTWSAGEVKIVVTDSADHLLIIEDNETGMAAFDPTHAH